MDSAEVTVCSVEDRNLGEERVPPGWRSGSSPLGLEVTVWCLFSDYKNNLLKAKAHCSSPPKVIDLDKGNSH